MTAKAKDVFKRRLAAKTRAAAERHKDVFKHNGEHSLRPAVQELERIFDGMASWFPKTLQRPVITIQGSRRGGSKHAVGGWFLRDAWSDADQTSNLPEINIAAESLLSGTTKIAGCMLHEMCHLANHMDGIKDCGLTGYYHNKKFKERAESMGLAVPVRDASRGWNQTFVTPELAKKIAGLNIDKSSFDVCRHWTNKPKPGSRMMKWACDCTIVRCATVLEAACKKCGEDFAYQDADVTGEKSDGTRVTVLD